VKEDEVSCAVVFGRLLGWIEYMLTRSLLIYPKYSAPDTMGQYCVLQVGHFKAFQVDEALKLDVNSSMLSHSVAHESSRSKIRGFSSRWPPLSHRGEGVASEKT
jgi:hypothetical protein